MTSDMNSGKKVSPKEEYAIDVATKKTRVSLEDFSQEYTLSLLTDLLGQVNLSQLQVFKPFAETVCHRYAHHSYLLNQEEVGIEITNDDNCEVTYNTDSACIYSGSLVKNSHDGYLCIKNENVYRHSFDGRETNDWEEAIEWNSGDRRVFYEKSGVRSALQLIKTNPRATALDSLYLVTFSFKQPEPKIERFMQMTRAINGRTSITHVSLTKIPINEEFFSLLGDQAIPCAVSLIRGINHMISKTQESIRDQQLALSDVSRTFDLHQSLLK